MDENGSKVWNPISNKGSGGGGYTTAGCWLATVLLKKWSVNGVPSE